MQEQQVTAAGAAPVVAAQPASYKVGVKTRGDVDWVYNQVRWPTYEAAKAAGQDLAWRWMAVEKWEVHPSDDLPNR